METMQKIRRQVGNEDWAWIAGILDGEGWFSLHLCSPKSSLYQTRTVECTIGVKNTDCRMLIKLTNLYYLAGIKFCNVFQSYKEHPKWKDSITVMVSGMGNVKKLIENSLPYLANKKDQAQVMLDYINFRKGNKQIVGCVRDPNFVRMHKTEAVLQFFKEMERAKQIPNASETTRRASHPIEMKI